MDLSKASETTQDIHRGAVQHPLGSAKEIGEMRRVDSHTAANALRRAEIGTRRRRRRKDAPEGEECDLTFSVKMGRARKAVNRYAHSGAGLVMSEYELGAAPQWVNSEEGLKYQVRRLQLVELVGEVIPRFWQQNTVGSVGVTIRAPDPWGQVVPVEWWSAQLKELVWLRSGNFGGLAWFDVNGKTILLPFKWVGSYHGRASLAGLDKKLFQLLDVSPGVDRNVIEECRPGMVFIVPDLVVGVQVRQALEGQRMSACIVDVKGRVLQPMGDADFPWSELRRRGSNNPVGLPGRFKVGSPEALQTELAAKASPFWAVNGLDRWRTYYEGIVPMPGLTYDELATLLDMEEPRVREYVADMKKVGVVKVRGGMAVLDDNGLELLAAAEGVKKGVVDARLATFADESSAYCGLQHSHTAGVAKVIVTTRGHGHEAHSSLGVTVKERHDQKRVNPDAGLVYAMRRGRLERERGLVVFVEYEQSARWVTSAINKLQKYRNMEDQGLPVPLLVVVLTDKAAENFRRASYALRLEYVGVITLEKFMAGYTDFVYGDMEWWTMLEVFDRWRVGLERVARVDWAAVEASRLAEEQEMWEEDLSIFARHLL